MRNLFENCINMSKMHFGVGKLVQLCYNDSSSVHSIYGNTARRNRVCSAMRHCLKKRRTELLLRQRGDKYVQTFQRRARARDLAALAARRRHDGQDGLRIHRLPRGRAPDLLAGAAARSYRLRRLAVPVLLCGSGQPVSDRHGPARGVRSADGGRGALRRLQRLA